MPTLNRIGKDAVVDHHHTIPDARELARRFHENEAVRLCYERKRELRRKFGLKSPLPENILDHLDWIEAERECRITRAIGFQKDA